jgi:uncharacterized membrane protein (DUF373 family)
VSPPETAADPTPTAAAGRLFRWGEDVLYGLVAVVLVGAALVVLADATHALITETGDGVRNAIKAALDSLLVVFILVELLGAVRETVRERRLVAEPFLLVGIIASIKEIVVVGAFADEARDLGAAMLEIGVLGAVVLGLSVASFLLRRKEREPGE